MKNGHYALGNILYYPAKEVILGPEVQWGKRKSITATDSA